MSRLDELAATALLGTDRRPATAPEASGALAAALEALPWTGEPSAAVLGAAGLITVHDRAGRRPPTLAIEAPTAAPAETLAECGTAAAALLARLAEEHETALMLEWLRRVAARGRRAPSVQLPRLLELGSRDSVLRQALASVGGARLAWLAAQNDEWSWAAELGGDADIERVWRVGSRDARVYALRQVRSRDAARGRALVETTWSEDPGPERAAFLTALRHDLTAADEPLLERALEDRASDVRAGAVALLIALPGSRLRARAEERLRTLVRVEGRLRSSLVVELPPEEPSAAERRDGIGAEEWPTLGRRASRLADLVARAPLDAWVGRLTGASDADAVLRLAERCEQRPALMIGWRDAVLAQADVDWALALARGGDEVELLRGVPPDRAEPILLERLRATEDPWLGPLLLRMPRAWSPRVSDAVITRLARFVPATGRSAGAGTGAGAPAARIQRQELRLVAGAIHPTAFTAARRLAEQGVLPHIDALIHQLDLREALDRELPQ